jgi:Holliday junction resolvase RusA-like endonuclease
MGALLPGGGIATRGQGRVRQYKDKVRLYTLQAVQVQGWNGRDSGGCYAVSLRVFVGDARVCDCDNFAKALLDGIKHVAFPDDRQVHELHVFKRVDRERPRVDVMIETLEAT